MPQIETKHGSLRDNVNRAKGPSPLGTSLWIGLRGLDLPLQHGILARGWGAALVHKLGGTAVPQFKPGMLNTGISFLDQLQLSPYRAVLFAMAVGSTVKQNFWQLAIANEAMEPGAAVSISAFNTIFNSLNTLLSIWAVTSVVSGTDEQNLLDKPQVVVGGVMYIFGLLTETLYEIQRKNFKNKPENKGKNFDKGLGGIVRHPNYIGYTFWRAGFATAAAGWGWGAVVFSFFFYDFAQRGVPVLDHYCQDRVSSFSAPISAKAFAAC